MTIPSLYGPKFNSHAYSEKIPGFLKEMITGDKKPLNVLYIQGLDDSFDQTKKMSREQLNEKVRSGEIKIKDLEGTTAREKFNALTNTLLALRQQGRINNATQIIVSCPPGEHAGELDIGLNKNNDVWQLKEVIDAIRGGRTPGQMRSGSDFEGAIHVFGDDPKEFKVDDRKKFGNVLIHASGKFNWSHHHAFMIGQIARASRHIKEGTPEEITRQVRDAIQPYAGYPIYRIDNEKVKVKYPTFRNSELKRIDFYQNEIKKQKTPIDMLISSVERDKADTFRIRLSTGGLLARLTEKKNDIGNYEKKRLLAALAASKTDQTEKLKILTEDLGIDFRGVNIKLPVGRSLKYEIERNRDRLEPEVIKFFHESGITPVPDNYYVDFICKRIEQDKFDDLVLNYPKFFDRLKNLDSRDVSNLTQAAFRSTHCAATIGLLRTLGAKFSQLQSDQLNEIYGNFDDNPGKCTRLIDSLVQAGVRFNVGDLSDSEQLLYKFFSEIDGNRESTRSTIQQMIGANHPDVKFFVQESLTYLDDYKNSLPFEFLISCGLDSNIQLNADEATALHFACDFKNPNPDFIESLIDQGAKVKKKTKSGIYPIDVLKNNLNYNVNQLKAVLPLFEEYDPHALLRQNSSRYELIHRAATDPNPVFLEALLDIKPGFVNRAAGEKNMTPLHCAILAACEAKKAKKFDKEKFERVVDLLLRNGADLDSMSDNIAIDPTESITTPGDYMALLPGYESYDLKQRQKELLEMDGAVAV